MNLGNEDPKTTRTSRGKLTQKTLESITLKQVGTRLFDGDNLRGKVRVSKTGAVSVFFIWRYVLDGRTREFYCGTWPDSSLATIRKAKTAAKVRKENGFDPAYEVKAKRIERRLEGAQRLAGLYEKEAALAAYNARPILLEVYQQWLLTGLPKRKSTEEIQRAFAKDVLPILGRIAIEDITRAHVSKVLDTMLSRGACRLTNRTLDELQQLFRFAIAREYLEASPIAKIKKEDFGGKDTERERVLSEEELRALARQLPNANLYRPTEIAIWLMLATACRIGELTAARWEEIDWQQRTWFIPAPKNKRPHTVFLSRFAIAQLEALKTIHSDTPWLYPRRISANDQTQSDTGPLDSKAMTRQISDRQRLRTPLSKRTQATTALCLPGGRWVPHDLRRTAATQMGELGVMPDVIEHCLNHTEPNRMKRIYQRQEFRAEQANAWHILGEHLELLIKTADSVDNIVLGKFGKSAA